MSRKGKPSSSSFRSQAMQPASFGVGLGQKATIGAVENEGDLRCEPIH